MKELDNLTSQHLMGDILLREQFVKDLNGTSLEEVMFFAIQVPLIIFFPLCIQLLILNKFNINVYKLSPVRLYKAAFVFIIEACTMILPLVLMFTLLSDYLCYVFITALFIILITVTYSISSPDDCVLYWKLLHLKKAFLFDNLVSGKQAFITYFRSLVLLVSIISILGVDFHVYPRRFAKTETFGVSLMDLGVGLFVISNALVVKSNTVIAQGFYKSFLGSLVLLFLGILRYYLVQRLDYQKHVSEYGIHWNFFITLAMVKLFSFLLMKISKGHSFMCGLTVLLVHQYLLSSFLEDHVLSNVTRNDWFNANREGIVSLLGYLSLYLVGVGVAIIVNPTDKQLTLKHKIKILLFLVITSVFLFVISYSCNRAGLKVSRRLANLSYIIWILSVSFAVLAVCLVVEFISVCFLPIQPRYKGKLYFLITPAILESINYNGMLLFLISNLLTGVVNLYVDVFNLNTLSSMYILMTYMIINCAIVFTLYLYNIQAKFW